MLKKIILGFIFLAFVLNAGWCENVMVAVEFRCAEKKVQTDSDKILALLETGLMDPFFEEGHIVFNRGIPLEIEEFVPFPIDKSPAKEARDAGADFLLRAFIDYTVDEKGGAHFTQIQFSFLDLYNDNGLLEKGTMETRVISDYQNITTDELVFKIGKRIALQVMSLI